LSKSRPDDSGSTSSLAPADLRPRGSVSGPGFRKRPGSRTSHCAVPFPKRRPPEKRACRIIWHVKAGLQARIANILEKRRKKEKYEPRTEGQTHRARFKALLDLRSKVTSSSQERVQESECRWAGRRLRRVRSTGSVRDSGTRCPSPRRHAPSRMP